MLPVPQIDFGSFKYAADMREIDPWWMWTGPSQAIQSVQYKSPEREETTECDYGTIKHVSDALANCEVLSSEHATPRKDLAAIAFQDATLLQCNLVNASYSSKFEYSNGQQVIRLTMGTSQGLNGSALFTHPGHIRNYSELYHPELCVAFRADPFAEFTLNEYEDYSTSLDCGVDLSALRLLSYQGIMAAFNQLIVGKALRNDPIESTTAILRTVPNYSSVFAPEELVNVSLPTYQNIYIYDRATLWIAYGLSLLFSTLAAIVGLVAITLSGASYSNQFSTIVRVAKTGELNVDPGDQRSDGFGRDPLPEHLKHARLDMRDHSGHADHGIPLEEGHTGDQSPRPDDAEKDTSTQETSEVQSMEQEGLIAGSGEERDTASMHHQSVSPITEESESDIPEIRDWQLWQRENGGYTAVFVGERPGME
ncbi:MAG: hypothetical protein Q9184_005465 [Pyrenodesmia sp. 2 TL-2023]